MKVTLENTLCSQLTKKLKSNEQNVVFDTVDVFRTKAFLLNDRKVFDHEPFANTYQNEKNVSVSVQCLKYLSVTRMANIIGNCIIYMLKFNDNASLKLKAQIASHENEDPDIINQHTDCNMHPSIGT